MRLQTSLIVDCLLIEGIFMLLLEKDVVLRKQCT